MLQMRPILLLVIFSNIFLGECGSPPLAPALYVFGDSIVDSGNNNILLTLAKANYPPYGYNFAKGPTGRFTNGKSIADFVAEFLGLPYPPPYISLFRRKSLKGYNYASGTCGILRETGLQYGLCLNLGGQIDLFEHTVRTELASVFKNQLAQHLAESIFIFSAGSNDYIGNYFGTFPNVNQRSPQEFAHVLVDALSQKLQKLYNIGARKVVVSEVGPIGCMPSIVRKFNPNGKCDENINQIVSIFNSQLALMLKNLTSTLKDSHFLLGRIYSLAYDAIINPGNHGLSDSSNPCCITLGNGAPTCIIGLKPCAYPNKHLFWDEDHPTEAAYSTLASSWINGSSVYLPMNIQQLVQL